MGGSDENGHRRRFGRWRLRKLSEGRNRFRRVALDLKDAGVVELQPERAGDLAEHLPRLFQRCADRDGRPEELDPTLQVGVAALLLGETGGRKHHRGAFVLGPRQVVPSGVVLNRLENYRAQEYHYVYLDLSAADRIRASSYAYSCLRQKYDRLGFVLLTLAVLTGEWFEVPERGRQGCVTLIAKALQRAGVSFARRPNDMTPADLAKNFGVMP